MTKLWILYIWSITDAILHKKEAYSFSEYCMWNEKYTCIPILFSYHLREICQMMIKHKFQNEINIEEHEAKRLIQQTRLFHCLTLIMCKYRNSYDNSDDKTWAK
jgi:hypothetical protein